MVLYELVDVVGINGKELGNNWKTRIGRKGYFVGEVDIGLCMMFSYRLQYDYWGFISAPVRVINGVVNKTDLVIYTEDMRFALNIAENSDD